MNMLTITRYRKTANVILGIAYWDGFIIGHTLENAAKAIPESTYHLTLTNSPKFGPDTILVNRVEGRTNILIHPANKYTELKGCIALGKNLYGDMIGDSRELVEWVKERIKGCNARICLLDIEESYRV